MQRAKSVERAGLNGAWRQRLRIRALAMADSGTAGAVAALDAAKLAGVDLGGMGRSSLSDRAVTISTGSIVACGLVRIDPTS
jgi:hypothetical protein